MEAEGMSARARERRCEGSEVRIGERREMTWGRRERRVAVALWGGERKRMSGWKMMSQHCTRSEKEMIRVRDVPMMESRTSGRNDPLEFAFVTFPTAASNSSRD